MRLRYTVHLDYIFLLMERIGRSSPVFSVLYRWALSSETSGVQLKAALPTAASERPQSPKVRAPRDRQQYLRTYAEI